MAGHGIEGEVVRQKAVRRRCWAIFGLVATAVLQTAGTAEALSNRFVYTGGGPIPANFGYYSQRLSHYEVYMTGCQSPGSWDARVRETAGGSGAQIRNLNGPCGGPGGNLALSWWGPDADTRVWCYNRTSSSKYANCWELYV